MNPSLLANMLKTWSELKSYVEIKATFIYFNFTSSFMIYMKSFDKSHYILSLSFYPCSGT